MYQDDTNVGWRLIWRMDGSEAGTGEESKKMTRRSRSVFQLRLSLELQDFGVFLEQVRTG